MLSIKNRRPSGDEGAVAVIVSLLFASLVIFAMGALAVDTGQFYAEKGQLQNGADAAAVAVAESCAKATCDTGSDATSTAGKFANANANDQLSAVEQQTPCGSFSNGCSLPNLCPDPPASGNWVDVQTSTLRPGNSTVLPDFFAKTVLGNKYTGTTIHACAQAQWGPPGGGTGLALTMSVCDWLADTASTSVGDPNAKYANPEPPYPASGWPPAYPGSVDSKTAAVPNPGGENVFQISGTGKCGAGQSGLNVPGGFGWLSDSANGQTPANCQVTTDANGYAYSSSGGIGGQNGICGNALQAMYDASKNGLSIPNLLNPIFVPVFDLQCNSNGTLAPAGTTPCPVGMPKSSYHIAGYAQFVLTGVDYNPINDASLINNAHPCKGGSFSCLYGLFTKTLVPSPSSPQICTPTPGNPCPSLGPNIVKLTG